MKVRALAPILALALAGCQAAPDESSASTTVTGVPAAAATPATSSTAATTATAGALAHADGYGHMRFGMDESAFRHAWQGDLTGAVDAAGGCSYLRPTWVKQPRAFGFMFERGRFVRYDVGTAREVAPGGGRVGMNVAQIRARYGDAVQVMPHKYTAGASYLRIVPPQGQGVLVFETDAEGKVVRWRVGLAPQIDYVEGCG